MRRFCVLTTVFVLLLSASLPALAGEKKGHEPGKYNVTIYHVAAGQHLAFLEWMAAREKITVEAGGTTPMWFMHLNGDSWDFITIGQDASDEVEKKISAGLEAAGLADGIKGAFEIRHFLNAHTDTDAWGPTTAAQILAKAKGD